MFDSHRPASAFKYINRIKHLYDRERASSTESIHTSRLPLPLNSSLLVEQRKKAILSPQNSVVVRDRVTGAGCDELNSDQEETNMSAMSSSLALNSQQPTRSNKYIKQLRDTFDSGLVPFKLALDNDVSFAYTHYITKKIIYTKFVEADFSFVAST